MKLSPDARYVIFGLAAGWLMVGLVGAGLLIGLERTDGLVQYPGAVRVAETEYELASLPKGYIQQHGVYHTPDTLPQVLKWYVRYLKPGLDRGFQFAGNCIQFTDANDWLLIQQGIGTTLCPEAAGTIIFVNRTLTLPH